MTNLFGDSDYNHALKSRHVVRKRDEEPPAAESGLIAEALREVDEEIAARYAGKEPQCL